MKKIIFVAIILGVLLLSKPLALLSQEAMVTEKCLVQGPCCYLGKYIITEGIFLDTSTSLLDDWHHNKCTRFNSRDYINFRTNDIFQYFMEQCKADIICSLTSGDKIIIYGWVMSCEDKRPWIEVDSVVKAPRE